MGELDSAESGTDVAGCGWVILPRFRNVSTGLSGRDVATSPFGRRADISVKEMSVRTRPISSTKTALRHLSAYLGFFKECGRSDTSSMAVRCPRWRFETIPNR